MATSQEVKETYKSTLQDLTCNSKPLISVLTMLAEENVAHAKDIAEVIEAHLAKVRTEVKLPVLYLIDCIVKNVGGPYTAAFSASLANMFTSVFQVVDEKTRMEMFKLRQTWNDVFSKSKLYALDVKTNQMDPAWPVPSAPPNIHLNPKFLNSNAKIAAAKEAKPTAINPTALPDATLDMQQQLLLKQKQLLELQQRKLELELLQTQVKLQEQIQKVATHKNDDTPKTVVPNSSKLLLKPEVAKQLLSDKKDESAKAMIAQINQRFPVANHSLNASVAPVNNMPTAGAPHVRPPIRDPRLLRQAQQAVQNPPPVPLMASKGLVNLTSQDSQSATNAADKKSFRVSRFDTADEPKKLSRIPLKSKRASSPANKSKSTSRNSKPSSGSNSSESPKKSSRSSSKSPSKSSSKYSKNSKSNSRSSDKRSKRNDRRSPKKDKGRNYRRDRPISISPELDEKQDVDLRIGGPPEKQARINDPKHDKDVDLRTNSMGGKRLSSEVNDGPNNKKNRAEIFDALFGSEDVDLRKLSTGDERPITPPAPIISNKPTGTIEKENTNGSQEPEPAPKLSLEVLRAKLANATNANKDYMQKSRLQAQAEQHKQKQFPKKDENKIFITSAEEENILSGNMTKTQESNLIGKMIAQIENQKLKEAKRKENEVNLSNMMTQPISDDEFDSDVDAPAKKSEETNNVQPKQSRFEPRFVREQPQWKGKRGAFVGARPARGRADPWIRPLPQGPLWAGARPLIGPVFEEDGGGKVGAELMEVGPSPPSPLQDDICMSHENIKSINIDGEPRDILFYGETAIAFMSPDDPREISFQAGQRLVSFDDLHSYVLTFNEPYRDVLVGGHCHRVRLGAPTREIYIDGKPHECFFGGPPIYVELDGKLVMIKIDGPAPQVKIGSVKRTDLVAGKVNLIIDAKTIVPIYLDGRTQTFDIGGSINTLRFKDRLETVLINDQPHIVEFGGLPKGVMVNGRKHFIRFSVLPKGVRPGCIKVRDMEGNGIPVSSEGESSQDACDVATDRGAQHQQPQQRTRKSRFSDHSPDRSPQNPILNLIQQPSFGNLDNLLSIASTAIPPLIPPRNMSNYQIEKPPTIIPPPIIETHLQPPPISQNITNPQIMINTAVPPPIATHIPASALPPPVANPMSNLNINDLFQKLVATGIVTTLQNPPASEQVKVENVSPVSAQMHPQEVEPPSKVHKHEVQMKLVSFDDPSSLKVRQPGLVHLFYSGMQCSSCGMRFAQENSSLYSQHLDWHFRQNRKGKKNIRKASSRRWYYSISDWNNYEEIEDLEEREKCYFENQQKDQNEGKEEENEGEIEIPSVPTDVNDKDPRCEVCEEKFEQFYNEEKEEWHLKMAIRVDDRTYHPLCYEDLQESLANETMDQSNTSLDHIEQKQEATTIPGLDVMPDEPPVVLDYDSAESKPHTPKSDVCIDETTNSDKNLNCETKTEDFAKAEDEKSANEEPMEADDDDDVVINEVEPERIILDDYEYDENGLIAGVVVKQEPIDDGFTDIENFHLSSPKVPEPAAPQDESFMDIGEISEPAVPTVTDESTETTTTHEQRSPLQEVVSDKPVTSADVPVETPATESTTTTTSIVNSNEPLLTIPTIDGNLDCNNAGVVPSMPAGGMGGKIKINISKQLPVIAPKENKDNTSDVDNNIEPIDPIQPLPPGEEPPQLYLKPALQGIDFKQLPPVNKGSELTGLCSIM